MDKRHDKVRNEFRRDKIPASRIAKTAYSRIAKQKKKLDIT